MSSQTALVQALLQAHTERLTQQNKAEAQQLVAQHSDQLQSKISALATQHKQQLQTEVDKAASQHLAEVTKGQQLLEKAEAQLAAEKQKSCALKV